MAALGKAEANLQSTRLKAERYKELVGINAVSKQDYDDAFAALGQAQSDVAAAKANVESSRINLAYARVDAPISGRIGKSTVTDGAIVTAYQPAPLASIQQLDPIYVDVPQSTTELLRLQRRLEEKQLSKDGANGKQVRLLLGDGMAYPIAGALQFRDVSVDPTTASVILRMVFPNPNGVLLPGMFVRAVVEEGVNEQAILIPQQAIARNPKGDPMALILDSAGKVDQKAVVLDRALGNEWLVTSGLAPGDRLIIEGMQKVRPGLVAREVPASRPAEAAAPAKAATPAPAAK